MDERMLVRGLTPSEYAVAVAAKTGDRLSDGSILLRSSDMDRMGLEACRRWIQETVLNQGGVLALFDERPRCAAR